MHTDSRSIANRKKKTQLSFGWKAKNESKNCLWFLESLKLKELSDIDSVNTSVEISRAEIDVWKTHQQCHILATITRTDRVKPKIRFVPGNRQLYDMDFPNQNDKKWGKFNRMWDLNIPSYWWIMRQLADRRGGPQ